jgi:ABC-type protease/lipase transport system fused ATPase/permease subunit
MIGKIVSRKTEFALADAALVLGILSVFTWLLPWLGLLIAIGGIVVSVIALIKMRCWDRKSTAGLVLSVLGFILGLMYFLGMFTPVVY